MRILVFEGLTRSKRLESGHKRRNPALPKPCVSDTVEMRKVGKRPKRCTIRETVSEQKIGRANLLRLPFLRRPICFLVSRSCRRSGAHIRPPPCAAHRLCLRVPCTRQINRSCGRSVLLWTPPARPLGSRSPRLQHSASLSSNSSKCFSWACYLRNPVTARASGGR
jgi:hypothetical protein